MRFLHFTGGILTSSADIEVKAEFQRVKCDLSTSRGRPLLDSCSCIFPPSAGYCHFVRWVCGSVLRVSHGSGADLPDHNRKASADRPFFLCRIRSAGSDKTSITTEPMRSRASTGTFCVRFGGGGGPHPEPGPKQPCLCVPGPSRLRQTSPESGLGLGLT